MVTIERAINGATAYLDRELVPHLPGWKAVAVSGVAALYAAQAPKIIDKIKSIPAVQMLGVLSEDGQVDIDALYNAFAPKVTGPLEFAIPFVGALSLDRAEVDKLYRYIKEA